MKSRSYAKSTKWIYGSAAICGLSVVTVGSWRLSLDAEPALYIPASQLPSPNAFDFYSKAGAMHRGLMEKTPHAKEVDVITDERSPGSYINPGTAGYLQRYPTAKKEEWLKANAQSLTLLRQGFTHRYVQPPARSVSATFPYYADYRKLARLLVIESHARSERGDWKGATQSMLDALRLGHDVPRGGPLIASLVGCAINAIARKEFYRLLPHLDAATAREAARSLEKMEVQRVTAAQVMMEEKWYGLAATRDMMRQPNWRNTSLMGSDFSGDPEQPPVSLAMRYHLQTVSKRTIVQNYLTYMDAAIKEAAKPYPLAATPAMPNDPINAQVLPVFARYRWNIARDETCNTVLSTMLALRAYRLDHGQYPTTLSQLLPLYRNIIPSDPFAALKLHYSKVGTAYLLYSIGPDGKDDGGRPLTNSGFDRYMYRLNSPDAKGDYVAGINE